MKRTTSVVDSARDIHSDFKDKMAPFMLAGCEWNGLGECIYPADEDWMNAPWYSPFYPQVVDLDGHNHVNLFLDAPLILCDHCARVFLSRKGVLHFRNILCNAASVTQRFQRGRSMERMLLTRCEETENRCFIKVSGMCFP